MKNIHVEFFSIGFSFLISLFAIYIAKKRKFFELSKQERMLEIPLKYVFSIFGIYLFLNFVLLSFFIHLIKKFSEGKDVFFYYIPIVAILNLLTLLFIFLFSIKKEKTIFKKILRETPFKNFKELLSDIRIGFFSWFLVFPIVMFFSGLLNILIQILFKTKKMPEQLALDYLNKSYSSPIYFFLAAITIAIFAPIIEEFLFRGVLQTYLNKFFKKKSSILITSLFFSFFHFSFWQKLSNITIISILFILSLFLGFLYEKRKSLISPIILHATFNIFSIFNLLMLKIYFGG